MSASTHHTFKDIHRLLCEAEKKNNNYHDGVSPSNSSFPSAKDIDVVVYDIAQMSATALSLVHNITSVAYHTLPPSHTPFSPAYIPAPSTGRSIQTAYFQRISSFSLKMMFSLFVYPMFAAANQRAVVSALAEHAHEQEQLSLNEGACLCILI